ncbi:hypothetical protein Anas_11220 [Armadillidium nasatum]|uniref:Uncharacterized protein n=1 Tax=Armadillidium nasatum TaxID=96803 RepID=A0A5N5SNE8_9CRUS|nr:hypothetical protein Anas_11220 [Armadillidium nasatum]
MKFITVIFMGVALLATFVVGNPVADPNPILGIDLDLDLTLELKLLSQCGLTPNPCYSDNDCVTKYNLRRCSGYPKVLQI